VALRAEGAAAGQQLWVDSSRARGCGEGQLGWRAYRSGGGDGGDGGGRGRCWGGVWCAEQNTKLLSMYCCLLACELRGRASTRKGQMTDGPWGGGTVASSRLGAVVSSKWNGRASAAVGLLLHQRF